MISSHGNLNQMMISFKISQTLTFHSWGFLGPWKSDLLKWNWKKLIFILCQIIKRNVDDQLDTHHIDDSKKNVQELHWACGSSKYHFLLIYFFADSTKFGGTDMHESWKKDNLNIHAWVKNKLQFLESKFFYPLDYLKNDYRNGMRNKPRLRNIFNVFIDTIRG